MKNRWGKITGTVLALVVVVLLLLSSGHPAAKFEGTADAVSKLLMVSVGILMFSSPFLVVLIATALVLPPILGLVLRLARIPNYTIGTPAGISTWTRLAPSDIVFRLASLAAANLVLYWLPIYYSSTYTPSEDDRGGFALLPSIAFCPISWVLGILCYVQAWRGCQIVSPRYRVAFCITTSMLLLVILSTLIPQVRLFIEMCS